MLSKLPKIKSLLVLPLVLSCIFANAQKTILKGVVTSKEVGETLPGVTVRVEGTNKGTITNIDGEFSLEALPEDVLVISFLGFVPQKITVGNKTLVNVAMDIDVTSLDEVVVVGYGEVKKSDLTGAISSVDAKEITAFPVLSVTQTLQGRAAGVQIQSNNGGQPGGDYSIKVRGGTSINASSNPIVVVDGFVGAEMPPPEDVASIEVLKDASATAMYGSRGANGVIMVTTKKGVAGELKIEVNSSYSVQETTNKLDLLRGEDFADYMQEFGSYEFQGANTDWQDIIYQSGYISNNQLSISGGSDKVKFYVSGTYFDQEGIVIGSDYNRYSINANVDIKANDRLDVGINLYGRRSETAGIKTQEGSGGAGQAGVIGSALRFNPDLTIYDDAGAFVRSTLGGELDNPYALATEYQRERITDRFQSNAYANLKILDWLSFKSTLGIGMTNWRDGEFWPTTLVFGEGVDGLAGIEARKQTAFLTENYFTINKEFTNYRVSWVNGYSFQKSTSEAWENSNSGFISNSGSFWALDQGSNPGTPTSGYTQTILKSYYTRANVSIFDRYKLTVTARYDGASNFAANNKWAFFPSGALAWNVSEEPFMDDVSLFDDLKLRASYGVVGNQAIGAFSSLAQLSPTYSIVEGENALKVDELENADLTWETTTQLDIGIDVGFVGGRIALSADYYDKETSDLLFRRQLPSYVGVTEQWQNIGTVRNKGYEFTLNTRNIDRDFKWSSDFVFSTNKNEIIELPDSVELYGRNPGHLILPDNSQLLLEGEPIGVFYGYVYDGIYQNGDVFLEGAGFETEAGGEKFADISGPEGVPDGVLDTYDRKIIGDPNPDFSWSLNNSFEYKGIDLNVFMIGVHGHDMLSYTLMELETLSGNSNATTTALRRWTPENPNTDVPKANGARAFRMSDRFIYDGSFVRVKNVVLGYSFPKSLLDKVNVRKLRIYASAQNLFTFTDYPGLDPEVGYGNNASTADGNKSIGLDYGNYPNVRSYTFGINLGF